MRLFPHANIRSRTHVLLFVFLFDMFGFFTHVFAVFMIAYTSVIFLPQLASADPMDNSFILPFWLIMETIILSPLLIQLVQCAMLLSGS
ncbi:hypothetical protein BLA29_014476, partial [Euroglyphus maynei]